MTRIERRGKRWRARVRIGGIDCSESFATRADAAGWARQQEVEVDAGKLGRLPDHSFGDLLDRYIREVVPTHRGERAERLRLERLRRDDALSGVKLPALSAQHIAAWRDRRLMQVSVATVLREWNALSAACTVAVREWGWLRENPLRGVKRPSQPPPRQRIYLDDEIERVLHACGYTPEAPPLTQQARVGAAVVWALATAMRAGEIVGLTWDHVDSSRRVAHLPMTKNGTSRDVPLSTRAMALLDQMKGLDTAKALGINSEGILDALWRKARDRALLQDAHFHDLRATALTRMASKLSVL